MNGKILVFAGQFADCMSQEDAANSFGKEAVMVALRGVFSTAIPPFPIDDASNRFK